MDAYIRFGFEMQKEINRLRCLPEENALYLLGMYLDMEKENKILQEQLIYAIKNNGEYLKIDNNLMQ